MTQVERWQYFFGLRKISQGSDIGGVKVFPNDWDFCEEGLIIVDGRVCVRSGTIDIEALRIDATSSPGMSLERDQEECILNAAKRTVFIETEIERDGEIECSTGTGFFVSEDLILTAKHIVVPDRGKVLRIATRCEGLKIIENDAPTWECQLVAVMPKADPINYNPLEDLAILRCPGHYSPRFLHLSADKLENEMVVHIIGYPGAVKQTWLRSRHESLKGNPLSNVELVQKFLPQRTLTVTEGCISEVAGGCARYAVSTVPGMSGGCLLYQDKVCGVHLGHEPNTAVLFSADPVREFLKQYKVLP